MALASGRFELPVNNFMRAFPQKMIREERWMMNRG
jgi:hypothetical protein